MSHDSFPKRVFQTPQGLITLVGFFAGLTGWIILQTQSRYNWLYIIYPIGALLALAGYGFRVVHFYILAAGIMFTEASILFGAGPDSNSRKFTAAWSMLVICVAFSFVGYPFKLRKNLKLNDPFNLVAILGILLTFVSIVLYYVEESMGLGAQATYQIWFLLFFIWGAFGGSTYATALAVYTSGSIITNSFALLVGYKLFDATAKAAILLGLFGAAFLGGVIVAIVAKEGKSEEEEQPLLK